MLGYMDMHDFTAGVTNHEENMKCPEENRLHADEVASPGFASVLPEKDPPPGRVPGGGVGGR
jgi:hypothetical protein